MKVALRSSSHSNDRDTAMVCLTLMLHSALHRIQTLLSTHSRNPPPICCTPLFIAFKRNLWRRYHRASPSCTPLFIAFKRVGGGGVGVGVGVVALRSSLHSNAFSVMCFIAGVVALHSALHCIQTISIYEQISGVMLDCTPLFIAFKQGGLLRSFSKRGEHTASERGIHLEC